MIYKGSRYTNTSLYDRKGALAFHNRQPITFSKNKCKLHTFAYGDRLDTLAVKYYGNPQLYWVILEANTKYRCEMDIKYGDNIIIPNYEEVSLCLQL